MCRYQGEWHTNRKLVFPAYVLLESENEKLLRDELRRCESTFEKERDILKMNSQEERLLRDLSGKTRHIGMSRGVICNGVTRVNEGPLKGRETQICKIDRHKRLARLQTSGGGDIRYIPAGLEIVEKSV